jgi:cell division septation protein DedD
MGSSQDTEITLSTAKLLGLFFSLVVICAVFFTLGYMLGRKSDMVSAAVVGGAQQAAPSGVKPGSSATPAPPMTFYKAVEQKDASAQLTPASEDVNSGTVAQSSEGQATAPEGSKAEATAPPSDPTTAAAGTGYLVQVAAVSKQDDADALVDALKKKQYPAFVAANSAIDKLFRVQVGPFPDIKTAESMRSRLIDDGYNPILKK